MQNLRWKRLEIAAIDEDDRKNQELIYDALNTAYHQGGWCVAVDEGFHVDRLGLRPTIEGLMTRGRSLGISMINGAQRPVHLSRFVLSESSHAISFPAEGRDRTVLKEAFGVQHALAVEALRRYQMAWTSINDGMTWTGFLQDLGGEID